MAHDEFNRRSLMRWGLGTSTALLLGDAGRAQSLDILGVPINLGKIGLPSKPLNKALMIAEILALERKATALRLPFSPLDAVKPPPLVPSEDSFYDAALPRLVSLIDRSEESDPETADKAAELLAQVNAEERVAADAFKPEELRVSRTFQFAALKREYAAFFESLEIRPEHGETLDWYRKMIQQSRARYEAVGNQVQVPWYFIGAIHGLEASFNFRAHLHNGDFPLTQRTRQVPVGRPLIWGPPSSWEASAKDALKLMGFAGQTDWSLERTLHRLEAYNGFGYRKRAVATPYLWSFSNHYERGKFVADGHWSPTARSQQCGAAVLMKTLVIAGDVKFG
jgi:lysozyme family protein